ncbi:MAG: biopolymer transporter ExbD [Gemmataceae bacterium]
MKWKVRHQGSPEAVERSLETLTDELADGVWETTDEIQEPDSSQWVAFENHPAFEEMCEELEAPPKPAAEGEAHLDFNALIDVTMVLLIFFILTTTVAALQKRIEAPTADKGKKGITVLTKEKAEATTILLKVSVENGEPVVMLQGRKISLDGLAGQIRAEVTPQKTTLLLDHDDFVSQDVVVQIISAAKAAGLDRVQLVVP